jgi:hypothetical protein
MTRLAVCAYVYGAYGGSCRFSAPHSLLIDGSVYCFVAGAGPQRGVSSVQKSRIMAPRRVFAHDDICSQVALVSASPFS